MTSDGSPWRPVVHVEDICDGDRAARWKRRADAVNGEVFNVGRNRQNYRIREIAEIVGRRVPGLRGQLSGQPSGDNRSYRVSFDKIATELPGFKLQLDARSGAPSSCGELFERIEMSPETYEFRAFTRLKQLKYLQRTGQIETDLYWTPRMSGVLSRA